MNKKNIVIYTIISVLLIVMILTVSVLIMQKHNKVLIASGHPAWSPIMYQEGDMIAGAGPEIVKKVFVDLGINVVSRFEGSWDKVQDKAKNGSVDVLVAAYKTADRETYMDYSIPYTIDPVVLVVKAGEEFTYNEWSDLIDKKGVRTVGDSYGQEFDDYLQDKLIVEEVSTPAEAFTKVANGKVDYFVYALYSAQNYIKDNNISSEVEIIPKYVSAENFYLTISKKSSFLRLLPKVNKLLEKYKEDGTIDQIIEEYQKPMDKTTADLNAGKSRDQIEEQFKWDLTALFANIEAWQAKKSELEGKINEIQNYKGKLTESADKLYAGLNLAFSLKKDFSALSGYAYKLSDQDIRATEPMAMTQEIEQLGIKLSSATSFIDPEILTLEQNTLNKFFQQKKELKEYAHYIDDIQRLKPHKRSTSEEEIISQAGLISNTGYDVYTIFKDADMPRPTVEMKDGQSIRLDDSTYTLYRADSDREVRKNVFETFFGAYKGFERLFGADLYNQVKGDIFYKNVFNYNSSLESALNDDNIPVEVYQNLLTSVHNNLPTLHRYLQLRKKILNLDELHYYDMYTPLVNKLDTNYTVDEAKDFVKRALTPLGDDYLAVIDKAFADRWIDFYPSIGKASGAYSSGSGYDSHPYILMNFMGKFDNVSTLAHELGHTMHSYYSNKNQTFANSHYPTFLAEVASINNENLLAAQALKETNNPEQRLSILGNELESYRTTLFRQAQFAEFELKIHELAEEGKSLTGEKLSEIYLDILKTYYGDGKDGVVIDDLYGIEWAYIPHFYYNFYVFQYATSLCASTAISEKILTNENDIQSKYINEFLSAGGSDYPIPILKRVGVDMTTTEPCQQTFNKMNAIMDEIETILQLLEKNQ